MAELNYSTARSTEDVEEAFHLALGIFSENSGAPNYPDQKSVLWKEDPDFEPGNLLLARNDSNRLVGMVRLVPRSLYRASQRFTVAGISSVCIAPAYRGRGNSASLMTYALEQSRARGFDLALLFARRAADHYYTRFGFWGISSYNKATIAWPAGTGDIHPALVLQPADPQHVDLYARAHAACYRDTFGYFERSSRYWEFLLRKAGISAAPRWFTIADGGVPVGYVVASRQIAHEIAWLGNLPALAIAAAVSAALPERKEERVLLAELPPRHRLLAESENLDVALCFRECSYGGHMLRILNTSRACELMAARIADRLARFGLRDHTEDIDGLSLSLDANGCRVSLPAEYLAAPSYRQTCRLLGASALSLQPMEIDSPLPFNVSFPDHL